VGGLLLDEDPEEGVHLGEAFEEAWTWDDPGTVGEGAF